MWDDDKQQRLDALRLKADTEPITSNEQGQLETLLLALESAEWATMHPALRRLRAEQAELQADLGQLQAQNAVLSAIAERYANLLARASLDYS